MTPPGGGGVQTRRRPPPCGGGLRKWGCSDRAALGGLRALLALRHLELDLLVVLEGAVARTLDLAEVREQVLAAVVGGDEAEALFSVEPLDGSSSHNFLLGSHAHSWIACVWVSRVTSNQRENRTTSYEARPSICRVMPCNVSTLRGRARIS